MDQVLSLMRLAISIAIILIIIIIIIIILTIQMLYQLNLQKVHIIMEKLINIILKY